MINNLGGSSKSIEGDRQVVYDHLRQCATHQPAPTVIEEFQNLFVQGKGQNSQVSKALEKIIFDDLGQRQFSFFFSRCFYEILNCWVSDSEFLIYISQLLEILNLINQAKSYDRRRKQLFKLIKDYQQSPDFYQLKIVILLINPQAFAQVEISHDIETNESSNSKVGLQTIIYNYLERYTYLYDYFCPQDLGLESLSKFIKSLEITRSQDFEFKLSKHILYRFRLKQMARMKLLSKGAGKVITKAENPSLLSERAFGVALKQYLGKIERDRTLLERSQRFVRDNQLRNSYQVFKLDLHLFLTKNIKPRNHYYNFDLRLKNKLDTIFPQSDSKPINKTLILQTCKQLFSFLVMDSRGTNNPQILADLIANLGTAQVMLILTKIILICPESKPDLIRKIAAIVNHYQFHNIQEASWVLKILEHLLIILAIYFGKVDVSIASKSIKP